MLNVLQLYSSYNIYVPIKKAVHEILCDMFFVVVKYLNYNTSIISSECMMILLQVNLLYYIYVHNTFINS